MTDPAEAASPEQPAREDPAPADTSDAFRLRGVPPRVTRLSRKALAVLGVAAGVGIGGSLIYALQPHGPVAPPTNLYSADRAPKANAVTAAPADYSKVPKLGPPLPGDLGRPILTAQANGQIVPAPPMEASAAPPPDPQRARAEQARQRAAQERDTARTSSLFLAGASASIPGGGTSAAPIPSASPTTDAGAAVTPSVAPPATGQASNLAFLQVGANRMTGSIERATSSTSPYVLQAGSIIPAALITGIRSDLPGQITAQVTQNVYDSPTGRILLIPQGARLTGTYSSEIAAGQNRVLLAWDRLILTGGRSILLDRQPGADAAGMAGLQDRTNYHWGNMLKAALVSTLLGVGSELASDSDDALTRALRYGTQDTINQTGRQLVQREMNVPPTLTIRPGFPLCVIVTRDLILELQSATP
ncbi:TrbI/VirB10 family protein [Sphingomonas sp. RB3P16]|uniref:TrbI/VirB10 family protein n=1 Tax=Parasphingomonas frigoris TaxID=3096163 RepID=UPI002FC5EB2A